jgi:P-type E1-E2 ATPase
MIEIDIPGRKLYRIHYLVLDVNGTIACDGRLIDGVADRLRRLSRQVKIHLLTADTHGNQENIDKELGLKAHRIRPGDEAEEKAQYIAQLGAESVAAVGNGANDAALLAQAELSLAVLGPEGTSLEALNTADVIVKSINDGLDLFLHPNRLVATLRK